MLSFLDTHTRFFVWLLLLLAGGHVAAQERFTVSMEVRDDVTKHRWGNLSASVFELQEDGSTKAASNVHKDYYSGVLTLVFASKPLPGQYTVSIMPMKQVAGADDPIEYRYEWPTVKIVVPSDAADTFKMPTVYLKRKKRSKELNEVTVTASKIMFYNKGDTLVYNADAFVLSEGTMLDGTDAWGGAESVGSDYGTGQESAGAANQWQESV